MNLERMKQLAGVTLNESVSAVPGIGNKLEEKSKSEKQARFMAAAAHNPEFAKKTGMDSDVAKEFNKADTGTKQLSNAMKHKTNEEVKKSEIPAAQRKAKGGDWKVSTDDLKKENPTNQEFMANRKKEVGLNEGDVLDEEIDAFGTDEPNFDTMDDVISQKMQRLRDLSAAFVDNHKAFDTIAHELSQEGYSEDDINYVMDALHDDVYGSEPEDNMSSVEADADALASAGWGTDEDYGDYGSDGMYEATGPRPGKLNPDEINSLQSLPPEDAKLRAQEMIAATDTRDDKKAFLANQIDRARTTMDVIGLLYNMVLKGEGQGSLGRRGQGSSYSTRFDKPVKETPDDFIDDEFDDEFIEPEEEDNTCRTCAGTGIGQYGDPDTSRCHACRGRGFVLPRDDDYDGYDDYEDDGDYVVGEAISLGDPELGMPKYYLVNHHTGAVTAGPFNSFGEAIADKTAKHFIVKNGIHTIEYGMEDDDGQFTPADKGVEEAYDFNNGYYDINNANGSDYFPSGADSPVTKNVGPSGAHQGDNPEQKRMQVAEVHKELVYSYRNFLKESKSKK